MILSDALWSLISGGLLTLFGGLARELISTHRYQIEVRAQQERDRLIAEHPEAAAALAKDPISKPPTLGPLAVMLALAGTTGAAAGPVVAPHVAAVSQRSTPPGPQCKSCDPPCPRGQYCSGGTCVSTAETPEGAAASLSGEKGGFMVLPGWVDTQRRTPWDYNPALDRQ
jgi:hypothetical protein